MLTSSLVFITVIQFSVCVVADVNSWNDEKEELNISFNLTNLQDVRNNLDKVNNYNSKGKFRNIKRRIESIPRNDVDVALPELPSTSLRGTKHYVLINKYFGGKSKHGHNYFNNFTNHLWSKCCSVYLTRWSLGTKEETEKHLALNTYYESWKIFITDIWPVLRERFNFKGSSDWLVNDYDIINLIMVKMSKQGDFENLLFSTKLGNVTIKQQKVVKSFMEHLEACRSVNETAAIMQTIPLNSRNKYNKRNQLLNYTEHRSGLFKNGYETSLTSRRNIDGHRRKKQGNENMENEEGKRNKQRYKYENPRSKRQVQTQNERLKLMKGFEKVDEKELIISVTRKVRLLKQKSNKREKIESTATLSYGNLLENTDTLFETLNKNTNKTGNLSKEILKSKSIENVETTNKENEKIQRKSNRNKKQVTEVTESNCLRTDIVGNVLKTITGTEEQAKRGRIASEINAKEEKIQRVRKQRKFVIKEDEKRTKDKMKNLEQSNVTKTNAQLECKQSQWKRYKGANASETSVSLEQKRSAEAEMQIFRRTNKTKIGKYSRKQWKDEELNTHKFSSDINKAPKQTPTLNKEYRRNLTESTGDHVEQSKLSNGKVIILQNENNILEKENNLRPKTTKGKRRVPNKVTLKLIVCLQAAGNNEKKQILESENVNDSKTEKNRNETDNKLLSSVSSIAYENDFQQDEKLDESHYFRKTQKATDASEIENKAMNHLLSINFMQNETEASEYSYETLNSEGKVKQEGTLKNKTSIETMNISPSINKTRNLQNIQYKFEKTDSSEDEQWIKYRKILTNKIKTLMEKQASIDERVYKLEHKWEKKQGDLNKDFVVLEITNDSATQARSKGYKYTLQKGSKSEKKFKTTTEACLMSPESHLKKETESSAIQKIWDSLLNDNGESEKTKTKVILNSEEVGFENTTEHNDIVKEIQDPLLSENKTKKVILDIEEVGFENTTKHNDVVNEMQDPLLSENKTKDYIKTSTGEYGIIGLDEVGFQNTTQESKTIKEMQDLLSETRTKENQNIDKYRIMDSEEISYGNTTQNSEIMKQPENSVASENRIEENKKTKTDKYVTLALEKMWYGNETENNENQIQTSLLNGIKEKNTDGYVILNLEEIGFENTTQNSEVGKETRDLLFSENITKEENKVNTGEYGIIFSEIGFQNTTHRSKIIKEIQDSLNENGTKENKSTDAHRIMDSEEISYGNPTRNSNIKQTEYLVRKTENGTEENEKITDIYVTLNLKKKFYKDEAWNKVLKQMQVSLLNGSKEVGETNTHEYVTDSEEVAFVNTTQGIEIKQTQDLSLSENGTKENKEIINRIEIKISDPLMTENERQEYTETNMDKYLLEFDTNEYEETTENKITRTADLLSSGNEIQEQTETNTNGYVTNRSTKEEYQENEINQIASKPEKFLIGKVIQEHKYLLNGAKEEKYGAENKNVTEISTSFLNENNQKQMKKVYGHNVWNILSEDSKETLKTTDSIASIVDRLPNGMYEQEKGKYLKDFRGKVTEDKEVVFETVNLALNENESATLSTTNKFETQKNRKYNIIKEIRLPDNNESFSSETDYSIVREDAEETEVKGVTSYNRETEHYDEMELKEQTYLEAITNEKLPKEKEKATLRDEETSVSTEELENAEQVAQGTTERERNAESPKGKDKTMWNLNDSYNKEETGSVQTTSYPDAAYENESYKILNGTAKIQLNEIEKPSVEETDENKRLEETSLHNKENLTENTSNIYPREETENKIANKMVNEINVTGKHGEKTGGNLKLQTPKATKEESSHRKTFKEEMSEVNLQSEKAVKTLAWVEKKYAKEKTWKEEDGAKNTNKQCNRDERTFRTLLKVCVIKSYLFFLGSRSFISEEMITSDVCKFNKQWCTNVVISTVEKCIQAFFCDFFNCNVLYCPFVLKIRVCPSLLKFGDKCSNDEECPYRQLCCYNGCYRACREGVENHPFYY